MTESEALLERRRVLLERLSQTANEIGRIDERLASLLGKKPTSGECGNWEKFVKRL